VTAPPDWDFDAPASDDSSKGNEHAAPPAKGAASAIPSLGELLEPSIARAQRRAEGKEKPVPLPWPTVAEHFGGGLWSGVHFLAAGTGVGKSALALQITRHAAGHGVPVAFVGLEFDAMQFALRVVGDASRVPWSKLYLGKAGERDIADARACTAELAKLPIHPFLQRPQGWSAGDFAEMGRAMRSKYPEPDGPGTRPILFVLDYLQIIGDELDERGQSMGLDPRERVGHAAYALRALAIEVEASVLVVSSVARDKYGMLFDATTAARLDADDDGAGRPVKRCVLNPDALVGLGKESGEIEFSADSVSVLARVPGTYKDGTSDVLFVTAKGRATGATWSAMHFMGYGYREADDGGSFTWEAMRAAGQKRERQREEKRQAKDDAKTDKIVADASKVATYVLAHDRCTVSEARVAAVANQGRRWNPAVAKLGAALKETPGGVGRAKRLTVELALLPSDVRKAMGTLVDGHSPPNTPPLTTPTVGGSALGSAPTVVGMVDRGRNTLTTLTTVQASEQAVAPSTAPDARDARPGTEQGWPAVPDVAAESTEATPAPLRSRRWIGGAS
jgi:hypothetical protein